MVQETNALDSVTIRVTSPYLTLTVCIRMSWPLTRFRSDWSHIFSAKQYSLWLILSRDMLLRHELLYILIFQHTRRNTTGNLCSLLAALSVSYLRPRLSMLWKGHILKLF